MSPAGAEPARPALVDAVRAGWDAAVDLVLPRPCPGCDGPGPWCHSCDATLRQRPRRVRLPEPAGGDDDDDAMLPQVWALARYVGPVRSAIIAGKERGRRDLPALLGDAMGEGLLRLHRIGAVSAPFWLVPAPGRRAAARRRGGDPVHAMAVSAARYAAERGHRVGVAPCLRTAGGARDSVGLDAAERAANLAGRVTWLRSAAPPAGASVLLVDDVLTTGATASAAYRALRTAGMRTVGVMVLASVPGWVAAH